MSATDDRPAVTNDSPTVAPRLPRPAVTDAAAWQFPLPRVTTLDNGLEVWVFDLPGQHVIALDLVQPFALDAERPDVEGVGLLAMRAADEGTRAHPHGEISALLEGVGAAYSGQVNHHATVTSLDVPSTRLHAALPLFAEIVRTPDFDEADLSRHQALRLAEIEQARASGAATAGMALRRVRWAAGTRLSRPAGGTPDTVSAITREDVLAFHRNHWGPAGSTLVVGGDFSSDPTADIARLFGDWRPAAQPRSQSSEACFAPGPPARTVRLVHRPEAVQIDLRIGGLGTDRHDPDWPALQAASVAVGGSFLSRLNRVIREERGYTYGIHLSATPQRTGGVWTIAANVRTDVAAPAIDETLRLLDVAASPLTEAEVADARTQIIGVAPLHHDTAEAIVGQASTLAIAGFDTAQVARHHERLMRVTAEQATSAAHRFLQGDSAHLVVVGNAEQLTAPLERAGFTGVVEE